VGEAPATVPYGSTELSLQSWCPTLACSELTLQEAAR
jgi:hypothetical protein